MLKNLLNSFVLVLCLALPLSSLAHRVNVFAYTEGKTVIVESNFVGSGPAMNADITVFTPDGKQIFEGKTDKSGKLNFALPGDLSADTLKIVVNAGEGHRNEWLLMLSDTEETEEAVPVISSQSGEKIYTQEDLTAAVNENRAKIEREVIEPLKKQLSATQNREIDLGDIIGGIGWMIGIAGILAWWHSRRKKA